MKRALPEGTVGEGEALDDAAALRFPRGQRLEYVQRRDGERCVWCGRGLPVGHAEASLEHLIPRVKGGPAWPENEVVACRGCNHARGHVSPVDWILRCRGEGRVPAQQLIRERLGRLAEAIVRRGGQRRARPYLDAQLRRWGRLEG
ncbi:MAG: hypothetical protein RLZZ142_1219 [Verrucomicrobiota bacterium]